MYFTWKYAVLILRFPKQFLRHLVESHLVKSFYSARFHALKAPQPLSFGFTFSNKQKSQGIISFEYGG